MSWGGALAKLGDVRQGDLPYEVTPEMSNSKVQEILNQATADGRDVWFRDGEHGARSLTVPIGSKSRWLGAGVNNTVLTQNGSGDDVITLSAGNQHAVSIGGMSIIGSKVGTGSGIHIPAGATVSSSKFFDLRIDGMGGRGFFDEGITFSTKLENVRAHDCLDHLFDIKAVASPAYTLEQCYAQGVPTAGKAGFRIRGGYVLMSSCNGVLAGGGFPSDYWGLFGSSVADDGVLSYARVTLLNCNLEDFGTAAIRSRNNGVNLINTSILGPATGTVKAIAFDTSPNTPGVRINSLIQLKSGGAWANGQAIHGYNNVVPPFVSMDPAASYQFWDDAFGLVETVSIGGVERVASGRWALRARDHKASERYYIGTANAFWSSGTGTPEAVVTAPVGSLFTRTDGGGSTTLYVKESGTGNTGWVAK